MRKSSNLKLETKKFRGICFKKNSTYSILQKATSVELSLDTDLSATDPKLSSTRSLNFDALIDESNIFDTFKKVKENNKILSIEDIVEQSRK